VLGIGRHLGRPSVSVNASLAALATIGHHVARITGAFPTAGPAGAFGVVVAAVFSAAATAGEALKAIVVGGEWDAVAGGNG